MVNDAPFEYREAFKNLKIEFYHADMDGRYDYIMCGELAGSEEIITTRVSYYDDEPMPPMAQVINAAFDKLIKETFNNGNDPHNEIKFHNHKRSRL